MASHHKYNEHKPLDAILDRIAAGETIALVSDAGTPGISDPGFLLAREPTISRNSATSGDSASQARSLMR